MMPKVSGLEFFKWVKARPELADVPVLMVTALAHLELPQQVTAVLRKPYRPDRLLAVVDGLCGNSMVGKAEAALRARRLRMGGTSQKLV
jgi:CheY-like chemotaxis protein